MSQRQYVIQHKQQAGQERCRTTPEVSQITKTSHICEYNRKSKGYLHDSKMALFYPIN